MSFSRTKASGVVRGGPSPTLSGNSRTRSWATEAELPRFYEGLEPTYQVSLGASAGRLIREEIGRERYLETAGWLFSDPRDSNLIVAATGPGSDGVLSPSSVQIGSEGIDRVKGLAPHLVLVGDWHSHPSADTLPSETDRRAWQRGCELTRSHWIGLVYAPAADMWSQPQCDAFITIGSGKSFFCERLRLREL
jgi:proteasome lid subunit RPN8/RPN11